MNLSLRRRVQALSRGVRAAALVLVSVAGVQAARATPAPTILILGAVPQEIVPIKEALRQHSRETFAGIPCDRGMLGTHEVVVAITGIGKTNCAMVTAALVQHYNPVEVIWTGTGCRVRQSLRVGDVIVASEVMHYDVGVLTRDGMNYGDAARGGSPGGKPVFDTHFFGPDGQHSSNILFACDPKLLSFAGDFLKGYHPEPVDLSGAHYVPEVRVGFIVSGDLFGLTETKITDIRRKLDPDLLEMEGAPFAQVCTFFHVPFLVIRGGSDLLKEDNPDDYALLSPTAAREAAQFTLSLVTALP
jgi:adenosylhomocysteine nucleosidase